MRPNTRVLRKCNLLGVRQKKISTIFILKYVRNTDCRKATGQKSWIYKLPGETVLSWTG